MKKKYTILVIIMLLFFFKQSNAQTISQLSFYSPLISTFDMRYSSNHLVVSQNGLLIFDVTNPDNKPQLVAQTTYPGSTAYSVNVQGNYAYMAHGNNGILAIYDISNFNAPLLKGSVPIPATSFYVYGDTEPYGNYIYVSGVDSLYVVDIADPSAPFVANAIEVEHTLFNGAEDIAIERNYLYLKTSFSIQVFDITSPVEPSLITTINYSHTYNKVLAVDTVNHRLFLSWKSALQDFTGYDAYNITSPATPQFLFGDSIASGPGDFGIMDYSYFDNVLFISSGGGINAFDVNDASHGFVTGFSGQDIPNSTVSVQVRDSVFFNARGGGLEVLKYSSTPVPVCVEPDGLRQKVVGTNAVLYWNKKPGAKGYVIRYRIIDTNDWKYVPSKDNFSKLQNLIPGSAYTWEVRSVCVPSLKETSDWSLYNVFYVGSTASITISPNPVRDMIHVKISDASITQILITDLAGKTFHRSMISGKESKIAAASLKTGTYIVHGLDKYNAIIATTKIFKQ